MEPKKEYLNLKKPNNIRKTFSIQKEIRTDNSRKYKSIKDKRLFAINKSFREGIYNYETAEKHALELISNLRKELSPIKKLIFNNENEELLEKFISKIYSKRDLISPQTAKWDYARALSALKDISLYSASNEQIQEKIDTFCKNNKLHRRITSRLRTILRFIGRNDVILKWKRKTYKTVKFLTENEFQLFLKNVQDKELKILCTLAFYSGCRIGEIYALETFDIKDKNTLNIDKQLDRNGEIRLPKYEKTRQTYLFDNGIEAFHKWIEIKYDNSISRQNISKTIKKISSEVFKNPNKHICFHDLRHSYAVNLISRGISLSIVAQCLGNTEIVCQEHYVGFVMSPDAINTINNLIKK